MDEIFSKLIDASVRRLTSDKKSGFPHLRQVPSSDARLFVSYWEQAKPEDWDQFLRSDFRRRFWHGLSSKSFEDYVERTKSQWEFLPETMKMILGTMFVKRGRIPEHLRSPGATANNLSRYAHAKWLGERDIKKEFEKHFEMRLINREGSSLYQNFREEGCKPIYNMPNSSSQIEVDIVLSHSQ